MTVRELAEFVLNHELDEVIQKCEEILNSGEEEEAEEIINELLINGYDESTRRKALDFLYPDEV